MLVATEQTGLCLPTPGSLYDKNLKHENRDLRSQFGSETVSSRSGKGDNEDDQARAWHTHSRLSPSQT